MTLLHRNKSRKRLTIKIHFDIEEHLPDILMVLSARPEDIITVNNYRDTCTIDISGRKLCIYPGSFNLHGKYAMEVVPNTRHELDIWIDVTIFQPYSSEDSDDDDSDEDEDDYDDEYEY